MIMRRASLGPVAVSALLSTLVFSGRAAADPLDGLFVGGNFGYTLSTYSRSALDHALVGTFASAGDDLTLDAAFLHGNQTVWSADIGYMVAPVFSVEASYLDLGTLRYEARGTVKAVAGSVPASDDLDITSRGPTLALVGVLPMTSDWSVNARVGAYESKTKTDFGSVFDGSVSAGSASESSTALLAGAGAAYVLGAHWVLRLDYLYLDQIKEKLLGKSFNVSLVTGGVAYAF
jgi:opacity protein-like surface antigen